jgi:hypothetical protein
VSTGARTCRYCGVKMHKRENAPGEPKALDFATRQHVIPRWRGGSNTRENLRPCCFGCNLLLDAGADCPGLAACARAIVASRYPRSPEDARWRRTRGLLRTWVPCRHEERLAWWKRQERRARA